jgi:hypothetical protein
MVLQSTNWKLALRGQCACDGFAETQTDWKICGETENGTVAVERDREFRPVWFSWISRCPKMNGSRQAAKSEGLGFNGLDQIQTVLAG